MVANKDYCSVGGEEGRVVPCCAAGWRIPDVLNVKNDIDDSVW